MSYPLYLIFGLAPSIIWLLFYLRKDVHPEPNRQVIKIFLYGMIAAIPAIGLELGIFGEFKKLGLSPLPLMLLNIFIGIALVEEGLKYLVVKEKAITAPEFDEPLDAMLYMIIAALGFAALENVLILIPLGPGFFMGKAFEISIFRFLGATFLHALCSGLVGYFLALSLFETKKRLKLLITGLVIAVFLHGLYNFSITSPDLIYRPLGAIMEIEGNIRFLIPVIILISLALFVSFGFRKLKKLASVCKIK